MLLGLPALIGVAANGLLSTYVESIMPILLALIILIVIQAGLKISRGYILAKTQEAVLANITSDMYTHLQQLPVSFFLNRKRGKVMSLITYDAYILSGFICTTLVNIVPLIVTIIGAVILLVIIEPVLAIIVALTVPIYAVVMRLMGRSLNAHAGQVREENAKMFAVLEENVSNILAIKAFATEEREAENFNNQLNIVKALSTKLGGLRSILRPLVQMLISISVIITIWLLSDKLSDNSLTPAQLISFLLYAAIFTQPMSGLIDSWGQLRLTQGALQRFEDVSQIKAENYKDGDVLSNIDGAVEFKNIRFSYPERAEIFKGANLQIRAGETIALVGPNGVGKSTLVNLLMRFFKPDAGQITLDGICLEAINLTSLRANIGYVAQDPILFDTTLLANIKYGSEEASLEAVHDALKLAQLDGLMKNFPQGLQTIIGEGGIRLSGGERQRVALCRALLKSPKVLILDEPTAMFDMRSEKEFVANMQLVSNGRTTIIITHRPESLSLADRIFMISDGLIRPYISEDEA